MSKVVLDVSRLNAGYGEIDVLRDISLNVKEHEVVTLLGRNGAGKTTTLKAVAGLLDRCQGDIRFFGEPIDRLPSYRIGRKGLGYCPEERGIFSSLTVRENLTLPPRVTDLAWSLDAIYQLFPKLKVRGNSMGTKLSGGEQQMLAIARLLYSGARVLLLDEPTEGLAPVIIKQIGQTLLELKAKGLTVVLVEQNFNFALKVSDRFYVLDQGEVVASFDRQYALENKDKINQMLGV
ncbi:MULTISPECIES: ABC transporter ATP-binding protein [Marinobacter]|uniref:ABC transporter ATP-binding protein n=1 Tax=Marinobacter TaxID=2742 RepID=UPI0022323DAC|nr:ABC transporter ATP-binding protein [Marinobacter sp. AN1]UZD64588.1 ABC transporter ATP-binding protein [Marinobacter sp. AN1]